MGGIDLALDQMRKVSNVEDREAALPPAPKLSSCPDMDEEERSNSQMSAEMTDIFDVERRPSCINKEEEEAFIEEVKRKARAAGVRLSASDDDEGSNMLLHAIVFLFFVLVGLSGYMYMTKKGPFAECEEVVDATGAPAMAGSDAEPEKTVPA